MRWAIGLLLLIYAAVTTGIPGTALAALVILAIAALTITFVVMR